MQSKLQWQELELKFNVIKRHDFESRSNIATCIKMLALNVKKCNAFEDVVVTKIWDLVNYLNWFFEFQGCYRHTITLITWLRDYFSSDFHFNWYFDQIKGLWSGNRWLYGGIFFQFIDEFFIFILCLICFAPIQIKFKGILYDITGMISSPLFLYFQEIIDIENCASSWCCRSTSRIIKTANHITFKALIGHSGCATLLIVKNILNFLITDHNALWHQLHLLSWLDYVIWFVFRKTDKRSFFLS